MHPRSGEAGTPIQPKTRSHGFASASQSPFHSDDRLTDELAVRVMGWKVAPDRFIKSGRSWIPRWRFRPLAEIADAFQLLDHAARQYTLTKDGLTFTAEIHAKTGRGTASGEQKARTIALAVAEAMGLEVDQ